MVQAHFDKLISLIERVFNLIRQLILNVKIKKYQVQSGQIINFVPQGNYSLNIVGNLNKFKIDETSHLKSDTFIECSGGVTIGKYFHTGKSLTIFSTNHNYESNNSIPYDGKSIEKPVIIEDFVWCGANVTIVPGVKVGEGVVIGAASVVTKNVPKYAVIGGNPAKILKYRNKDLFKILKNEEKFF